MQRKHTRWHLGVFGESGSGKNTLVEKVICGTPADCVFIFDPEEQFADALKLPIARTPDQIDAAVRRGWVCFDPSDMFEGDPDAGLEWSSRYAWDAAELIPGRKLFVVDEAGDFMSAGTVPLPLRVILTKGRRRGLDGIFISRAPNELHNSIRAALSEVLTFQITDDTALAWLKSFGFDPAAVRDLVPDYKTRTDGTTGFAGITAARK